MSAGALGMRKAPRQRSPERATVVHNAGSLAAEASSDEGFIALAKSFRVLRLSANRPVRVRIYTSTAKRATDLSRPSGTAPTGDHGVIGEWITSAAVASIDVEPAVIGSSMESMPSTRIPIAITNLDTVTGDVVVTMIYQRLET